MIEFYNLNTDSESGKTGHISNVQEEIDSNLQKFADENDVALLAFIGSYVPRRYGPAVFVDSTMSVKDEEIEQALTNIVNIKVIIASYIS